jgi:hypothetical protein
VAGLLAVIINPQLLEPFSPRPVDVLGNAIFGIFLILTTERSVVPEMWSALLAGLIAVGALAAIALIFGANRSEGPVGFARAARTLSGIGTGRVIYTAVFFLSLIESFRVSSDEFRTLTLVGFC